MGYRVARETRSQGEVLQGSISALLAFVSSWFQLQAIWAFFWCFRVVSCFFGMAGDSVSSAESKQGSGYGRGGMGASVGTVDVGALANILQQTRGRSLIESQGSCQSFQELTRRLICQLG